MEPEWLKEGMVGSDWEERGVEMFRKVMVSPKSLIVLLKERSECILCWRSCWDMDPP